MTDPNRPMRFTEGTDSSFGKLPGESPRPWEPLLDGSDDTGEGHASDDNPEL